MNQVELLKMAELAHTPQALAASVDYLAEKLSFLRKRETVLILSDGKTKGHFGELMKKAVLRCDASPIMWDGDRRWKSLLRLAFLSRASTIIGPPLMILGLSKIARSNGTPLYIRNVVTGGYPCLDWMIDGIINGLDCQVRGCFDPGYGALIAGFSCEASRGVHLREDVYGVEVVGSDGELLPDGELGEYILYDKSAPEICYHSFDRVRLDRTPCACGCKSIRLKDIHYASNIDNDLASLGQYLQSWNSVLDCRMEKGEYGLALELVVLPGEKMPKLPSCAKLVCRNWDPETDEPFIYTPTKIAPPFSQNH